MEPFAVLAEGPALSIVVAVIAVSLLVYRVGFYIPDEFERGTEAPRKRLTKDKHQGPPVVEPPLMYRILIIALACSTCACVAYAFQTTQPAPEESLITGAAATTTATILATLVVGFLTTLATQVFKILEDRRKDDRDQRERKEAREAAKEAAILAKEEILARTELQRIETIHVALELTKQQKGTDKKLDHVQDLLVAIGVPIRETGVDTNIKVTELVLDAEKKKEA